MIPIMAAIVGALVCIALISHAAVTAPTPPRRIPGDSLPHASAPGEFAPHDCRSEPGWESSMAHTDHAARGNRVLALVAVVLAAAGLAELSQANTASGPPRPASTALGKLPPATKPTAVALATLLVSVPTHVDIPAVNLHADVIKVDLAADGTVGTPPLATPRWPPGTTAARRRAKRARRSWTRTWTRR